MERIRHQSLACEIALNSTAQVLSSVHKNFIKKLIFKKGYTQETDSREHKEAWKEEKEKDRDRDIDKEQPEAYLKLINTLREGQKLMDSNENLNEEIYLPAMKNETTHLLQKSKTEWKFNPNSETCTITASKKLSDAVHRLAKMRQSLSNADNIKRVRRGRKFTLIQNLTIKALKITSKTAEASNNA